MRAARGVWVAAAVIAVALAGCLGGASPALHPLTGTVMRGGQPVTEGGLIFLPEPSDGSGLIVNAHVSGDGTFTTETSQAGARGTVVKPGAPAGRYRVVYHPPSDGQRTDLEVAVEARVTVAAGDNRVTIELPPLP